MATNDLARFHHDVINVILNGEKDDDMDEEGDLQFGHLLEEPVKLFSLQGDMTHQVCLVVYECIKYLLLIYFLGAN